MFIRAGRGMGDIVPADSGCFSGYGPPPAGVPYCTVVSDSMTVTAQKGTGPLCFAGWMFPWLGRQDYNAVSDQVFCNDVLSYNGMALPSPWPAVITAAAGLFLISAISGGGGKGRRRR